MGRRRKKRKPLPPIWRASDELWTEVEPVLEELDPPEAVQTGTDPAAPEGCFDSEIYAGVYLAPIRVDRDRYVHAPTGPSLGFPIDLKEAEKVASEIL